MSDQEAFDWDLEQVRQLFGGQGANHPLVPLDASLPFRINSRATTSLILLKILTTPSGLGDVAQLVQTSRLC